MKTIARTMAALVLALFIAAPAAWSQTETPIKDQVKLQKRDQLKDGSCNDPGARQQPDKTQTRDRLHQTDAQSALVAQNRESARQFRTAFIATLSEEQLAILQNTEMTREQKRAALMASLTAEQRAQLEAQQQLRRERRSQFGNSVASGQMKQMRLQSGVCDGTGVQEQVRQQVRQQAQQQAREQGTENASGNGNGNRNGKGGN